MLIKHTKRLLWSCDKNVGEIVGDFQQPSNENSARLLPQKHGDEGVSCKDRIITISTCSPTAGLISWVIIILFGCTLRSLWKIHNSYRYPNCGCMFPSRTRCWRLYWRSTCTLFSGVLVDLRRPPVFFRIFWSRRPYILNPFQNLSDQEQFRLDYSRNSCEIPSASQVAEGLFEMCLFEMWNYIMPHPVL